MPREIVYMRSGEYDDEWYEANIKPRLNNAGPARVETLKGVQTMVSSGGTWTVRLNQEYIEGQKQQIAEKISLLMQAEAALNALEEAKKNHRFNEWREFFEILFNNSPQRNMPGVHDRREGLIDDLADSMTAGYKNISAPHLPKNNPPNPYGE